MYIIKRAETLNDFLNDLGAYPAGRVCFEPWAEQFPCLQKPDTSFRLAHNDDSIFVYMCCTNDDVRSEVREHNGPVNSDSCMEFYFAPGRDRNQYFNMEVNPAGFVRFKFGTTERAKRVIPPYCLDDLRLQADPNPILGTWSLSYAIPYSVIKSMVPDFSGDQGTVIRGMFCKCGDLSREKHFFTSAPVDPDIRPEPDFHAPEAYEDYLLG